MEGNNTLKSNMTVRSSVAGLFAKGGIKYDVPTSIQSPTAFQKIRICLVGDRSAGKTALVK